MNSDPLLPRTGLARNSLKQVTVNEGLKTVNPHRKLQNGLSYCNAMKNFTSAHKEDKRVLAIMTQNGLGAVLGLC